MSTWFLAPSLVTLRNEINAAHPKRDKSSDGAVGDTSHAARVSSHNPLWSAPGRWSGVVRAVDIDGNGSVGERTPLVDAVLKATIGDPRVWYVIWNRQIWSRTTDWKPKPYSGVNAHDKHVHVSLIEEQSAWADTSRWLEVPVKPPVYAKAPIGDVASWNAKVGDRAHFRSELDAFLGKRVVGLMETAGHRGDIARWATDNDYSIFTGSGDVGASSQLLVKHRSGVIAHDVIKVTTPWYGPKGKRINGRAFPWVKLELNGRKTLVVLVHMPWGPTKPRNVRAWVACSRALRKVAKDNPGYDVLIVGDLNQVATSRLPYSILGTANTIGGRIVPTGAALDYGIFRQARATGRPQRPAVVTGRKGERMKSDHPVTTYKIGA